MTTFIVEHKVNNKYRIELVPGVENLDVDEFDHVQGIWVCDSFQEATVTIDELLKLRNIKK
jgi:hypothetical protein